MSRSEELRPAFVEFIPGAPEQDVLYISRKYNTATHLCACGCGNKVVTPLKPGGWTMTATGDRVTLYPSIGNWNFECQSHYWVRANRIVWAPKWSQAEISAGRKSDQMARQLHFDGPPKPQGMWQRVADWLAQLFR